MATFVTYDKLSKIMDAIKTKIDKKLDATGIRNNDTTTDSGYVLDARMGKTLGDRATTLETKVSELYFATDGNGKWGYKTTKNGAVTPFRNPTGNATAAEVLSGRTFSSASLENASGTMTNRGAWTGATTGSGNVTIPAGYHNGSGYVSGSGAYNQGVTDADNRANTNSTNYKTGYNNGVSAADGRVNTSSASYSSGYNNGVSAADNRVNTSSASYNTGYTNGLNACGSNPIQIYQKTHAGLNGATATDTQAVAVNAGKTYVWRVAESSLTDINLLKVTISGASRQTEFPAWTYDVGRCRWGIFTAAGSTIQYTLAAGHANGYATADMCIYQVN